MKLYSVILWTTVSLQSVSCLQHGEEVSPEMLKTCGVRWTTCLTWQKPKHIKRRGLWTSQHICILKGMDQILETWILTQALSTKELILFQHSAKIIMNPTILQSLKLFILMINEVSVLSSVLLQRSVQDVHL